MILDFTRRMQRIRDNRTYSKTILLAMDYVSEHLHERILIQDAAAALSISVPYLSRLFKSEIGTTFSDYVRDKKVDAAIHLLEILHPLRRRSQQYLRVQLSKLLYQNLKRRQA